MRLRFIQRTAILASAIILFTVRPAIAEVIIAEGEAFKPQDKKGWKITHQNDSYGTNTFGGMWMTHGGCLGAAADSAGSVAVQKITVAKAGKYRVWSKYQAPPYFNYLHKIEVHQNGKMVYAHIYGKSGTDRLWSFSGVSDELWWPWGTDHDTAEAPAKTAALRAGAAEIRLIAMANQKPAGDRFVDFVVLTDNLKDEYQGFKPYRVGSPFALEALAATKLYLRFKNSSAKLAKLSVRRNGHFQPNYGSATMKIPDQPAPPGQWSAWMNVGPFCRLVHDEGLFLSLPGADRIAVQFSRDANGKDIVGDCTLANGSAVVVPMEITWTKKRRVKPSEQHAREIIAASKKWRRGKKPQKILFYGAFRGKEPWINELKAALGYNTLLPDQYEHVHRDGMHTHARNAKQIEAVAKKITDKSRFRIMSFGDEISLGGINYNDRKLQQQFRAWLKKNGITRKQLGVEPNMAALTKDGNPRLVWYSTKFSEEQRFAHYRSLTELTKKLLGPEVLTGANYSPHHGTLYYGPIFQWVDIFKHKGMSMHWSEDYIFLVPEVSQMASFMFAQIRCGVKYHNQPIHFYVMPHSPGQLPGVFRRNVFLAVGNGAAHIDNFWIAPAENFTENYIAWNYRDMFRALSESIYDTAEVENIQHGGKVRPARVALVTGRATDFNESRLMIDKADDPFARRCKNAPAKINQNLCRKEQQMLYLALRNAQYAVDAITEDDIVEGALKNYDVVYFAGEWIDDRAVEKLNSWVKKGGILYASGGIGHRNQFGESNKGMLELLGLKDAKLRKNLVKVRTLLEMPLAPPIGVIDHGGKKINAIGMRQQLIPRNAKVIATWQDGSAAVTQRQLVLGQVFAIGTCAGISWMKTALKPIPYARGGHNNFYHPVDFSPAATKLVRLGVSEAKIHRAAECSNPGVEAIVLDGEEGTLVTLINWTNSPLKDLQVQVRLPQAPKQLRCVRWQRKLASTYGDGVVTFRVDLEDADYVLLTK